MYGPIVIMGLKKQIIRDKEKERTRQEALALRNRMATLALELVRAHEWPEGVDEEVDLVEVLTVAR